MPARSTMLQRGRESFRRQAWADAEAQLSAADREDPVGPEDLERLAVATYLLGRYDESTAVTRRIYRESIQAGDVAAAARSAFWIAVEHLDRGEMAQAAGWLARAERVVAQDGRDLAESGYLLIAAAARSLAMGDARAALDAYTRADDIATRFSEPDLLVLARLGQGEALIELRRTAEGMALMDEVMVSVTSGEVSPVVVGIAYCSVIDACQRVFDLQRAQEWTTALDRWCESQPQLVHFRGQCLLNRAQLKLFHGAWQDAAAEAGRASERMAEPEAGSSLGEAIYQAAELHRLRGEFGEAETAYRRASRLGRRPEPGMALLRLAQGRTQAAAAAIRRATDETTSLFARPQLLGPLVEIMLAAGSIATARVAADEMTRIADEVGAPLLTAMAGRANGAVLLAEGDAGAALAALRASWTTWYALDAPYEAARVRVLIGLACRELGDRDSAAMELDAAREVFQNLGALPDLARLAGLDEGAAAPAGGLTAREIEVLRLVSAGKTNRAVAAELVISDKTVARHLSNIFDKLGVSSRAAATAYAYEHDLIARPA
ncbi:MAG TPA: LuxR C-terminal-related transcriptional regulator [Candidatus Limnocylindria bacterium]|nr:LuxR C-terminal-related transcriptional regulator [Candidatus Limnocylindria bacterium]